MERKEQRAGDAPGMREQVERLPWQQRGFLCSVPASDDHGRGKCQEATVFKPINWLPDR